MKVSGLFDFMRRTEAQGPVPVTRSPWLDALAWGLGVMVLSYFLRCLELPQWADLTAGGQRLLATHDGYAYLAGAKGASRYIFDPLTRILAAAHAATGADLSALGFWMPPLLSGLAALPVCLLCAGLGRGEAGPAAGLLAVGCFGYLIRTRYGFIDNDFLTLFFAVGSCAGLALWLAPLCRETWLPGPGDDGREPRPLHATLAWALALGLFGHAYVRVYPSGNPILISAFVVAAALGLLLARRGERAGLLLGLAAVLFSIRLGWPVTLCGAALCAGLRARPDILRGHGAALTAASAVVLAAGAMLYLLPYGSQIYELLSTYLNLSTTQTGSHAVQGLSLPAVIGSVREASHIETSLVVWYMSGHWTLLILGVAGYLWCALRRPLLLVLAPLLGLGLCSPWLGTRFTMYGGVAVGLGLALGLADLAARLRPGRLPRLGAQAVLLAGLFVLLMWPTRDLRPEPVLSRDLAESFMELKDKAGPDAVLWQWWDYSYAAQYYAERDTFGDGGRHSGDWLYPLALVHATSSPLQASQTMKALGRSWRTQAQREREELGRRYPGSRLQLPAIEPMEDFKDMGGAEAARFFADLGRRTMDWPADLPEQYLALTWHSLHFIGSISRFGLWDLERGEGDRGRCSLISGGRVDLVQGVATSGDGSKRVGLSELAHVDDKGVVHRRSWLRFGAPCCVVNSLNGEMYLMDGKLFHSMGVAMLLGQPEDFEPYFTLVVDRGAMARIYKLN